MAEIATLREAVGALVEDGMVLAMEGFTHLIPFAAGHEVIRQGRKELTLVRMTPDLIYDQMIGMGCAAKLVFSWGGNPGVGSLHRFRDAIQTGWPRPLAVEAHSHADMAARYQAGASGLPFAVLRGYLGSDLPKHNRAISSVTCPFTGEVLAATRALTPDVAIIHAQRADRKGNVLIQGITGIQKEAVLAHPREKRLPIAGDPIPGLAEGIVSLIIAVSVRGMRTTRDFAHTGHHPRRQHARVHRCRQIVGDLLHRHDSFPSVSGDA